MQRDEHRRDRTIEETTDAASDGPSLGVLIIGSLYWDNAARQEWRRERLELERQQCVRAPIRYGRRSEGRGYSYTMVLSASLGEADFGTAIVVPCKSRDLLEEAKSLWEAEGGMRGAVSGTWGCVGLLINPDAGLPSKDLGRWSKFVERRPGYGQLAHATGEPGVADKAGLLQIDWPRLTDGRPLMLDALLATATDPTLVGGTRYPSASEVAEAWDTPKGRENIRYFCDNRKNGIGTFQDADIEEHLRRLGHLC